MANLITNVSKYLMILLIAIYTYYNFRFFGVGDEDQKRHLCRLQNVILVLTHTLAYTIIYLRTEDEKALTAAQGIGKKIAQRIILELKDKLAKEQSSFTVQGGGAVPKPLGGSKSGEAAAALAVLGYGSQEISTALKGIDMDALPLEEIIRQALKKMVK